LTSPVILSEAKDLLLSDQQILRRFTPQDGRNYRCALASPVTVAASSRTFAASLDPPALPSI
jgi:hypothetical protein